MSIDELAAARIDSQTDCCADTQNALEAVYATPAPLILDLRRRESYHQLRLRGSSCVPLEELTAHCFLLPDKCTPFAVVAPLVTASHAARHLRGEACPEAFLLSRGWQPQPVLLDTPRLWHAARALGLVEEGADGPRVCERLRRRWLFQPAVLLAETINAIEASLAADAASGSGSAGTSAAAPPQPAWRALDIGCGSGRDAVWLAGRGLDACAARTGVACGGGGWQVVAVDEWLGALQRAEELALHAGLAPEQLRLLHARVHVDTGAFEALPLPCSVSGSDGSDDPLAAFVGRRLLAGADPHSRGAGAAGAGGVSATSVASGCCGSGGGWAACLAPGSFHLVLCVRFLERALLAHIPRLLAPGGWVLYCTWLDGPGLRAFGRPAGEERVLCPGELARSWFGPGQGFRVVRNEMMVAADGRELCMFASQKLPACSGDEATIP